MNTAVPMTEAQRAVIDEQHSRAREARDGEDDRRFADDLYAGNADLSVCREIGGPGWTPPRKGSAPKVAKRSKDRRTDRQIVAAGSKVYGAANPSASWVQDVATLRTAGMSSAIPSREASGAFERMLTYERELKAEIIAHTPTGIRARQSIVEHYRGLGYQPHEVRALVAKEMQAILAVETRDSDTTEYSLGSFCPPAYLLEHFQLYRTAAAPLVSQAGSGPLPGFGMKVEIPLLTAGTNPQAITASNQENRSPAQGSPTASFVEAEVGTYTSIMPVSQQVLDRTGPGVTFDQVIAEQAGREIGTLLDMEVVAAVLAGAQSLTDSGSLSIGALFADAAQAANKTQTLAGTRLVATTLLAPSPLMLYYMSLISSDNGVPIWLPRSGDAAVGNGPREGYSGYDVLGMDVFFENNGLVSGSNSTVLVGAPGTALLVLEAPIVVDVYPQWSAEQLTSLVRVRQYAAFHVLYRDGFCKITGDTAYPANPWSA